MEQTGCSETSAYKIQTPDNYPEESIQHFTTAGFVFHSSPCKHTHTHTRIGTVTNAKTGNEIATLRYVTLINAPRLLQY